LSTIAAQPENTLAALVAKATGTSPLDCYQCGRCAAGCMQNVGGEMELSPTRIMRLLQLESAFAGQEQAGGFARQALSSDTVWLCAGCQACTTRCPQSVDIAGTMDALREESLRCGKASDSRRARDIQAMHRAFLTGVQRRGRIHELALVMSYKLRSGHLLQDAMLGPKMLRRGKLHILPRHGVDAQRVQDAADRLRDKESGQ
jgi:heterodisulfide reductase subunit C